MNYAILGISGKAHSGKTTAYEAVKEIIPQNGYKIYYIPLAAKLKDIAEDLFGWDGDKSLYTNEDGSMDRTRGRGLLIEIGRFARGIKGTIWVDYVSKKILNSIQDPSFNNTIFIIDDIRYKNEMSTLSKFGKKFVSVRLSRKSQLLLDTESEKDLDDFNDFDYFIDNNGTKEQLAEILNTVVEDTISRSKGRIHA